MSGYFHTITEENKLNLNKPADRDLVYYSELNEWFTASAFRSFSLKYVVDQSIHYKVGRQEHIVKGGSFLLACKRPDVRAYFDSKEKVRSICIDICPATVSEAFTVLTSQENADWDNYLSGHFKAPHFFESVCPVNSASFAPKLLGLVDDIANGRAEEKIDKEWFLDLVEKIIYHEYGNYLSLRGIQSIRLETRKELLRRLQLAREYMDSDFLVINDIGEAAKVSNLSEFHFFRSFRQAFGISPYQFILKKRLDLSKTLLDTTALSITEIASQCNFQDVFTFSKAFKRKFHTSPSFYRSQY